MLFLFSLISQKENGGTILGVNRQKRRACFGSNPTANLVSFETRLT